MAVLSGTVLKPERTLKVDVLTLEFDGYMLKSRWFFAWSSYSNFDFDSYIYNIIVRGFRYCTDF